MTSGLLYLVKRELPYLELLVSFMSNQVSKSYEYDWINMNRGLVWLNDTIEYKHVIGSSNLSEMFTCIYAYYALHDNMRNQTGRFISMVYGIIHGKSLKKINVKRSTEAEPREVPGKFTGLRHCRPSGYPERP